MEHSRLLGSTTATFEGSARLEDIGEEEFLCRVQAMYIRISMRILEERTQQAVEESTIAARKGRSCQGRKMWRPRVSPKKSRLKEYGRLHWSNAQLQVSARNGSGVYKETNACKGQVLSRPKFHASLHKVLPAQMGGYGGGGEDQDEPLYRAYLLIGWMDGHGGGGEDQAGWVAVVVEGV
eukprot:739672-Pelagomonas_calceolata.AAC.2